MKDETVTNFRYSYSYSYSLMMTPALVVDWCRRTASAPRHRRVSAAGNTQQSSISSYGIFLGGGF